MNCPNCKSADEWRCPVYQSVDVEVDRNFSPIDNGLDFTSPELEKEKVFCDNCGYKPVEKDKENQILSHLRDILNECKQLDKLDLAQIEHNVFEIAEHLGVKSEVLKNA